MSRSLILAVKIIGDASDAIKAMDDTARGAEKFQRGLSTAAKLSGVALGVIAVGAKQAVDAASDLEQSTGAVSSVFGEYAAEMTAHAEAAADAVGLSQHQYNESATLLGAQLKNMGVSMDEVSGTTDNLIGLGSDLAATFGGTTADATAALSSLLRGERDPIEKYGVSIKQADIEAQKAAMGLDGLSGEAEKNADLQATLALLTTQTADAQGQFARETDTAAGSAQIAAAHYENAKAALGEALLPIVTKVSEKLAELARWFQENAEWITPLIGVIAGLAAGIIVINGAFKAFAAIQAIATAAQWANNAAWLASPITWIIIAVIAAVAALIVVIVLVVKHWDTIKEVAANVWQSVIDWVAKAIDWVKTKFQQAIAIALVVIASIKAGAQAAFQGVISWVQNAIGWIRDRLAAALSGPVNAFINLRNTVVGVFQTIIDWVRNALSWIRDLASNAVPGWAKKLVGMASFSAPVTPELAAFSTPDYAARMMVTPQLGTLTTPDYAAASTPAPIADANLRVMSSLFTAMASPSVQPRAAESSTTFEDNREQHFHFPNYTGSRRELVEWLRGALEKADRADERIIRA